MHHALLQLTVHGLLRTSIKAAPLSRRFPFYVLHANLRAILLSNPSFLIVGKTICAGLRSREKSVGRSLLQIENNQNGAMQQRLVI